MTADDLRKRFPKASEDFIRRNAGVETLCKNGEHFVAVALAGAKTKKRLRQHAGDGMNKWERDYMATLDLQWSHIYREVSLPLANGVRYKVDFLVVSTKGSHVVVEGHEVKGMARSTGVVKIKVAASLYPWIGFRLVTKKLKKEGGGWAIEQVSP